MEMTLQNIYFLVGAAGFLLAAICAISAVAYFFRADIRGVLADLSGKTRSAELAEFAMPKRGRSSKKSILTGNDEWIGGIAHQGDLAAQSGSDAITEEPSSGTGSGASSDWSYSDSVEQRAEPDSDVAETEVGSAFDAVAGVARSDAPIPVAAPVQAASAAQPSFSVQARTDSGTFSIVRQIMSVHSASAIDERGNEVPLESLSGGAF